MALQINKTITFAGEITLPSVYVRITLLFHDTADSTSVRLNYFSSKQAWQENSSNRIELNGYPTSITISHNPSIFTSQTVREFLLNLHGDLKTDLSTLVTDLSINDIEIVDV